MTSALFVPALTGPSCPKARSRQAVKATVRYLFSGRSRVRGSSIVTSSTPRSHSSVKCRFISQQLPPLRPLPSQLHRPCRSTRSLHSQFDGSERAGGNQPRLHANGFGKNPAMVVFAFKEITGWTKGTEHINGLELFFEDCDHLIEKWETLSQIERRRISNSD